MADFQRDFDLLDTEGTGTITHTSLGNVMRLLGHKVDEDELLEMINEVDEDGNGTIEFDEYIALMGYNMESLDTVDGLI